MKRALAVAFLFFVGCKASTNPDAGLAYPCHLDAGDADCRAGFKCGYDEQCFDPKVASNRLCKSDQDCGDWHCGVPQPGTDLGRCYEVSDAGAVACRRESDAGSLDCAPGWRCGLNSVCYDLQDAGSVQCENDNDCADGWRCGVFQPFTCTPASEEALSTDVPPQLTSRVLSPRIIPDSKPGLFSGYGALTGDHGYVFAADGGLYRRGPSENGDWQLRPMPPGSSAGVTGVAAYYYGMAALSPNELDHLDATDGYADPLAFSKPAIALRKLRGPVSDALASFSSNDLFITFPGNAGAKKVLAPPSPIRDIGLLALNVNAEDGLLAATDDGLFVAAFKSVGNDFVFFDSGGNQSLGPNWIPIQLTDLQNTSCFPFANTVKPQSLVTTNGKSFGVVGVDGKLYRVDFSGSTVHDLSGCISTAFSDSEAGDLCPSGETLDWVQASGSEFHSQCIRSGSPTTYARYHVKTGGASPLDSSSRPVEIDRSAGGVDTGWSISPSGVILSGFSSATFAGPADAIIGAFDAGVFVLDQSSIYYDRDDEGFAHLFNRVGFCSSIEGDPSLMASTAYAGVTPQLALAPSNTFSPGQGTTTPMVFFEDSDDVAEAACLGGAAKKRILGTEVNDGTGHPTVVVAGADRIWAQGLAGVNATTPTYSPVRLVPLPYGNISSLAMVSPPSNGLYLEGYVLVQQRLFHITATSDVLWRAEEILLPRQFPLSVWADGPRARVTFLDGTTYSLPHVIPLSGTSPSTVIQTAVSCGTLYALTAGGLIRLVPQTGSPIGVWESVDLPFARPVEDPTSRFAGGALHAAVDDLFVTDSVGNVLTVHSQSCR